MSLLTRWDPMQDIQEFEKRLSQVFPEGFKIDSMEFGLDKQH